MNQEYLVVCDNTQCDFKVKNPTGDPNEDISMYLNIPCPKCGKNLLTEEDYLQSLRVLKIINWLNKWFSWLNIFSFKKKNENLVTMHIHNGIKIKK
jgi:hypothetical protein